MRQHERPEVASRSEVGKPKECTDQTGHDDPRQPLICMHETEDQSASQRREIYAAGQQSEEHVKLVHEERAKDKLLADCCTKPRASNKRHCSRQIAKQGPVAAVVGLRVRQLIHERLNERVDKANNNPDQQGHPHQRLAERSQV